MATVSTRGFLKAEVRYSGGVRNAKSIQPHATTKPAPAQTTIRPFKLRLLPLSDCNDLTNFSKFQNVISRSAASSLKRHKFWGRLEANFGKIIRLVQMFTLQA